MTAANDSVLVDPGTGGSAAPVATHLIGGKEHQVVLIAGPSGNILGTRNTYCLYAPPVSVVGVSKLHFDVWNNSGLSMEVLFLSFFTDLDIAAVGVLAARMDVFRSTAIGTGGTAIGTEATTAIRTMFRLDPAMAALPATLTAREAPAGGATAGVFLGSTYTQPEEAATSMGYLTQYQNVFGGASDPSAGAVVVPTATGLRMAQGPVASVGKIGCRLVFTLT